MTTVLRSNFDIFPASALFSTGEVSINEHQVSAAGSLYSFRSYMETLLHYNKAAKSSWLTQELYYQDTAGCFNSIASPDPVNKGMVQRQRLTANSRQFDLMFRPHLELFNQDRMLIPCDFKMKLVRSRPQFYILNKDPTKEYKIKFLSGSMFLRTLRMSKKYDENLKERLNAGQFCYYPMIRSEVFTFLVPFGTRSTMYPLSKYGKLPIRIYLALIPNSAQGGEYELNPYNFENYELTEASFVVAGRQYPSTPLRITYEKDMSGQVVAANFLRTYNELLRTTGVLDLNDGNDVSRTDYPKGFFILGLKTTEAGSDTHFAPPMQGNIIVNLSFGKPVPALSCVLFLEYQNMMTLDVAGNVQTDYTAL